MSVGRIWFEYRMQGKKYFTKQTLLTTSPQSFKLLILPCQQSSNFAYSLPDKFFRTTEVKFAIQALESKSMAALFMLLNIHNLSQFPCL